MLSQVWLPSKLRCEEMRSHLKNQRETRAGLKMESDAKEAEAGDENPI